MWVVVVVVAVPAVVPFVVTLTVTLCRNPSLRRRSYLSSYLDGFVNIGKGDIPVLIPVIKAYSRF